MREVIIRIKDDWDGSLADETLEFRWRGVDYEIDLSEANVELADKTMEPLVNAARVVNNQPVRQRSTPGGRPNAPTIKAVKEQRRAIREWAMASGVIGVPPRGHLPSDAIDAYSLAHPKERIFPEVYPRNTPPTEAIRAQDAERGELAVSEVLAPRARDRTGENAGQAQRRRIREWAQKTGRPVNLRGYISGDVKDAYFAAHPGESEEA